MLNAGDLEQPTVTGANRLVAKLIHLRRRVAQRPGN